MEHQKNQSLTISHADTSPFVGDSLRAFFEYRDLNIKSATNCQFAANVIRAFPGAKSPGTWPTPDLSVQMVYVTSGSVALGCEAEGAHMSRSGSCDLVHHSDDMELIEIISPAELPKEMQHDRRAGFSPPAVPADLGGAGGLNPALQFSAPTQTP